MCKDPAEEEHSRTVMTSRTSRNLCACPHQISDSSTSSIRDFQPKDSLKKIRLRDEQNERTVFSSLQMFFFPPWIRYLYDTIKFTYDSSRFHFHFVSYVVPYLDRKRCPYTSLHHIIGNCSWIKIHMYLKLIVVNSQNMFLYILILWVSSFKLHYIFISIHLLRNIIIKKKTYHPNIRIVDDASSRRRMMIVTFSDFFMSANSRFIYQYYVETWALRQWITSEETEVSRTIDQKSFLFTEQSHLQDSSIKHKSHLSSNVFEIKKMTWRGSLIELSIPFIIRFVIYIALL